MQSIAPGRKERDFVRNEPVTHTPAPAAETTALVTPAAPFAPAASAPAPAALAAAELQP